MSKPVSKQPLLSLRTALILLSSTLIGVGATVLTYLDTRQAGTAICVGVAAGGGAITILNGVIGD
ncbi:MAG: hypothetical protein JXA67_22705 [Micromonosporaceae bacterium]|nr:hypothetical protein [Micromonosporaceae bacterium]